MIRIKYGVHERRKTLFCETNIISNGRNLPGNNRIPLVMDPREEK
jgi:hypothetical protein